MFNIYMERLEKVNYENYSKESLVDFLNNTKALIIDISKELDSVSNSLLSNDEKEKEKRDIFLKLMGALPVSIIAGRKEEKSS